MAEKLDTVLKWVMAPGLSFLLAIFFFIFCDMPLTQCVVWFIFSGAGTMGFVHTSWHLGDPPPTIHEMKKLEAR